jgi:putative tryptophan/tyrosine transport system substrate-binding protein
MSAFEGIAGSTTVWPFVARAQQRSPPVIGFLRSTSLAEAAHLVTGFRNGLKEAGFVEGQNVTVEYRSANDQPSNLVASIMQISYRAGAFLQHQIGRCRSGRCHDFDLDRIGEGRLI